MASTRAQITADIIERDGAFGPVVEVAGVVPARRAQRVEQRFPSLISAITYQLLATPVARTIHSRVQDVCGGDVCVESVLALGPERLRSAGLSRTKAAAMVDLATHVRDGRVDLSSHGRRTDAEIISEVTAVHGVGPWTVQMYLMSTLGRRDVWPVGDLGVRVGWSLLHGLDETIDERALRERGAAFVGVRSDVAWYCWQAVHHHRLSQ